MERSGTTTAPRYMCAGCLSREATGGGAAAVWRYGSSPLSGHVRLASGSGASCLSAVCPFGADPAWH